jgi:hypothetical protein
MLQFSELLLKILEMLQLISIYLLSIGKMVLFLQLRLGPTDLRMVVPRKNDAIFLNLRQPILAVTERECKPKKRQRLLRHISQERDGQIPSPLDTTAPRDERADPDLECGERPQERLTKEREKTSVVRCNILLWDDAIF